MHHDDLFRRVSRTITLRITIKQINNVLIIIHGGKFDVFDCVSWIALLTIYRAFQHDTFAGPCALINLILLPASDEVPLNPLSSCIRIISTRGSWLV
jgi:hypothetical protein